MATVEQRYAAAAAYVRRAIAVVMDQGVGYSIDPITGIAEWYAGRTKTETARNELARIEARWLRATTDDEREKIARDAELLADRVEEVLPGAPQDRKRTNLYAGEVPKGTPATSFDQEVERQAAEEWNWVKEKAGAAGSEARGLGKWLVVGGGMVLGWKVVDYLRQRERLAPRQARQTRRILDGALERAANESAPRNALPLPLRIRFSDTELDTWFERDRAHVELRDKRLGRTIIEWWDDEVRQAIEDGFFPSRWTDAAAHRAAYDYAKEIGLVREPPRSRS